MGGFYLVLSTLPPAKLPIVLVPFHHLLPFFYRFMSRESAAVSAPLTRGVPVIIFYVLPVFHLSFLPFISYVYVLSSFYRVFTFQKLVLNRVLFYVSALSFISFSAVVLPVFFQFRVKFKSFIWWSFILPFSSWMSTICTTCVLLICSPECTTEF